MKAQELISKVEKTIRANEYNAVTFMGVKGLSRADLEDIKMYAQEGITNGRLNGMYMKPMGAVKEVLVKSGVLEESSNSFFF